MFASSSISTSTLPPATYSLTSEDLGNTSLVDFWAHPRHAPSAYTVRTVVATRSRTFTTVTDAAGRRLATLEVRDMFTDRVSIRDGPPVSFSSWMKGGLGPFHSPSVKPVALLGVLREAVLTVLFPQLGVVSRREAEEVYVEEYRCVEEHGGERRMPFHNVPPSSSFPVQLYAEDTPGERIAFFQRVNSEHAINTRHSMLTLTPCAQEIAETCVVSFPFLEKRRRLMENEARKVWGLVDN